MALRNAKASAKSDSTRWRLRISLASKPITLANAIAIRVTSAVRMLGNKSGAARQLSSRNTMVLPGSVRSCFAVYTFAPRCAAPCMASRVPSASVNEISWLRSNCAFKKLIKISFKA